MTLARQSIGRSRKAHARKVERAFLVYQGGIANVFAVESFNLDPYGRDARRLLQHTFAACEHFAQGLEAAGVTVAVAACNQAGDITNEKWTCDLESQPFSDQFFPQGNWRR